MSHDYSPDVPFERSLESVGNWQTETDSIQALEFILEKTALFTIYKEVDGRLLHPRPFSEQKAKLRIDFILSPTAKLRSAGWEGGVIGLECKKSGVKINHPFAQAEDYTHCVWRLKSGFMFMCDYYFIWPYGKAHGFLASQMAQKRIGTLWHDVSLFGDALCFFCGENLAIKHSFTTDETTVGKLDYGFKTGSR